LEKVIQRALSAVLSAADLVLSEWQAIVSMKIHTLAEFVAHWRCFV
jgi:hypothetical protein